MQSFSYENLFYLHINPLWVRERRRLTFQTKLISVPSSLALIPKDLSLVVSENRSVASK